MASKIPPSSKPVKQPSEPRPSAQQMPSAGSRLDQRASATTQPPIKGNFRPMISPERKIAVAKKLAATKEQVDKILVELKTINTQQFELLEEAFEDDLLVNEVRKATPLQKFALIKDPKLLFTVLMPRMRSHQPLLLGESDKKNVQQLTAQFGNLVGKNISPDTARTINAKLSLMDKEQIELVLEKITEPTFRSYVTTLLTSNIDQNELNQRLNLLLLSPPAHIQRLTNEIFSTYYKIEALLGEKWNDQQKFTLLDRLIKHHPVQSETLTQLLQQPALHFYLSSLMLSDNISNEERNARITLLLLSSPENIAILTKVFCTHEDVNTLLGNRLSPETQFDFLDRLVRSGLEAEVDLQTTYDHYLTFLEQIKNIQAERPVVYTTAHPNHRVLTSNLMIYPAHLPLLGTFIRGLVDTTLLANTQVLQYGIQGFIDPSDPRTGACLRSRGTGISLSNEVQRTDDGYLEVYITDPTTMESTGIRKRVPLPEGIDEDKKKAYLKFLKDWIVSGTFEKACDEDTPLSAEEKESVKVSFATFITEYETELAKALTDFNATVPVREGQIPFNRRDFVLQRAAFINFAADPSRQNTLAAYRERSIFQLDDKSLSLLPNQKTLSEEDKTAAEEAFLHGHRDPLPISILGEQGTMAFSYDVVSFNEDVPYYLQVHTTLTLGDKTITRTTLYPIEEQAKEKGEEGAKEIERCKKEAINSHLFTQHLLLAIAEVV